MKLQKIPFRSAQAFSPLFNDYIEHKPELAAFYGNAPDIEAFAAQIELRNQNPVNRELLTGAIRRQYGSLALVQAVEDNLVKLAGPDAFTVVTGHQLNIFTGPLYFIYKIVTAINTARALTARYPDRSFVPVYWMASEDHDVEEINHFRLFGKTYRWDTPQQGPVGRFDPSTLGEVLKDLPEAIPLFEKAYLGHKDLASATRFIANELFGHEGLLVIDGDDAGLKAEFREIMADDLLNHSAHRKAEAATEALSSLGYKPQIFPREVNLFYLETGRRERIVRHDRGYSLAGSDGPVWTEQELLSELDRYPERFSPNVVLRPLYQEKILPNLAYIGGPAEVAYWLQLKPAFDHFGLPFPVLLPRNFALIVSGMLAAKLDRFGLQPSDLFGGLKAAKEKLLEAAGKEDVQLTGEMEELIASHPAVAECSVIGVEDELRGQVPIGMVVLKDGANIDPETLEKDLIEIVRKEIGAFAYFRQAAIVKRLPKTRSGKILRNVMRKIADGQPFQIPSTIDDPVILDEIKQTMSSHHMGKAFKE